DTSDPAGKLRERGKVYIPGTIADKFKMHWHDGYLRVFSQRRATDGGIGLHIVPTATPDVLSIATTLDIQGVRYSGLQATRFDGERAFIFWREYVQNSQHRYLNTIDLSQPLSPRIAARLEVPLDTSHLEVHGDRLLALGRHYLYYTNTRVALALYDIANLSSPRELTLARLGEGSSSSEANHDYKALKTFPKLNLILVPLRYWNNGLSFSGLQLVDWKQDTLVERGRVSNTGGVRRAFPVKDRLVAVGEMAVVSIDAQDRDNPTVKGQLRLVHHVHDVFEIQGKQVQLVTDVYTQQVRLEVRNFGTEDDSPTLAHLDLPYSSAPFVLRDGDVLHLIGNEPSRGQVVHNADLSQPTAPELRGDLLLTDNNWSVYHPGWGWYYYYWSPYAGLPLRNQIIPATFRKVVEQPDGRREWQSEMRFLDLRNIDDPRVAKGSVPMNEFPFVNKVTHGNILYSTHVEQAKTVDGESLLYHVRSYVDRVDVTDPDNPKGLPSINVPGYLVDVSDDGKLWYTIDYQWDDFGRRRNSLNALKLVGDDQVALMSVTLVADQVNRAARRPAWLSESAGRPAGWNDRTLWLTAHKYPWWGVNSDTVSSRQPYTVIRRVDYDQDGRIAADSRARFGGYHFNLLDVQKSQMVLSTARPSGIITVDLSQMAEPKITHTARTISYVGRVLTHDDDLYAPLGYFGLQSY
ncbi:MAG: beta-propeller domain-containing protein, partial [Deltaproteobacteria bacterium]|nr:beta-propeller domain-containing protein [Deltaproteobacteria bacterium]